MGEYFNHWLKMGRMISNPPHIFSVNWFRKDDKGNFIWPGFGDNMRVLKWIVERVQGKASAVESPLGWIPRYEDIDWTGLEMTKELYNNLISVDRELWKKELVLQEELFIKLYDKLPKEFTSMRELLLAQLSRSPEKWTLK